MLFMFMEFDPEPFGVVPARKLSPAERRRKFRRGELERHSHGVYLTAAVPSVDPWLRQAAAALVAAGPDAVLSRQAAAAVWSLDGFEVGKVPIELNVPRRQHPRRAGTHRPVTANGSVLVSGVPVTPILTTLLELGAGLPERWATSQQLQLLTADDLVELAVESALRDERCNLASLLDEVSGAARSHPGGMVLGRVLDRRPADAPPTESYLETRTVQVFRNAGLPDLERQVEIRDRDGTFLGRVDFARGRAIVEVDGHLTHDERPVEDRRRWTRLTAAGYQLAVLTHEDIEHAPSETVAQVRRILALAAA